MIENEKDMIIGELSPPFSICQPDRLDLPIVFNSPHSGRTYPMAFLESSRLDPLALRKSEDAFVDDLFAPVVELGAPLLKAHFPRAYLDVNREPYELDPELFSDGLPDYANTQSVRVVGGLGTIARIVTESEEIYGSPPTLAAALLRINHLYKPYHQALWELIERNINRFGYSLLIDCHSMPSTLSNHHETRPDFVLGDRFGTSCDSTLTHFVEGKLRDFGYEVSLNKPYAGGYITEHYGRPSERIHSLQIEVNRALYVDEESFVISDGFTRIQRVIKEIFGSMIDEYLPVLCAPRAAAE